MWTRYLGDGKDTGGSEREDWVIVFLNYKYNKMFIPGQIISILTFPGVIIHEWAHKKFCDWNNVRVFDVKYFSFGNPAWYVTHDKPKKYSQIFWISIGPLIINSLLTIVLSFLAVQTQPESFFYFFLLWIAISVGMHSFPSNSDAKNILEASHTSLESGWSILHILAYPFYGLIMIANLLRIIWFDLWYALFLIWLGGWLW